ncbi:glycosyltransferase [Novosphingobium sp. 9]|uniref:glycosyltransferase n=1 Tax=Novosphingobium sp. 9 TaxID=2025349 RepID=UPI0021B51295|nr:glycosyltransferase [Novosphingobium sp. 9]
MPTVDILLATYQNARYLPALMDSLAAQTRRDFRLLVSDDCSNDGSADIVESYADRFDRFELIRRASPSGSAKANFSFLLERADADYVLFADADDVWDHDKVERTLAMLESGNAQFGSGTPHYVFSDVRLIDGNGGPKGPATGPTRRCIPVPETLLRARWSARRCSAAHRASTGLCIDWPCPFPWTK